MKISAVSICYRLNRSWKLFIASRRFSLRPDEFLIALLLLLTCMTAFGSTLVVPGNQAATPGNAAIKVGATATRFQEIVGSGQFNNALVITGIRVRSAVGSGPVSFTYASYKVTLSTTKAFPNTANGHALPSATYANNVGPDATTVYNAPLSASSPGCSGPGPCPFDLVIHFSTSFPFDPSQGRLLVDITTSAPTGTVTGSFDGVVFPDSANSSVAIVTGDPANAAGTLSVGGVILGIDGGVPSLTGSFGFLINTSIANTSNDSGTAILGVMNFDGAGNVTGSYNFQLGASAGQAGQSATGTFTGTYSSNPDGTGTATLTLDAGITFTFAIVITDGGQGLQLVATGCTDSCDLGGIVISGVARAAYAGPVQGTYGFHFNNSPDPGQSIGVLSFDGAGNVAVSLTFVSAGMGPNHDPHQAPVLTATSTGTYSVNPDGSGTIVLPAAFGGQGDQTYAFVIVDSGSELLSIQMNRSGNGVSSGTARLQ